MRTLRSLAGGDSRSGAPFTRRLAMLAAGLVALLLLASCTHLGYYTRSLVGGAKVLLERRPVAKVLSDPETPAELARQLELAVEMRSFAVTDLALPDNDSYLTYAALDRPYAMWNVVAAPELSIEPKAWCFLIVGCVAYRGYFSERGAERFAGKLRRRGFDVDVSGVAAYSTAGWFADPLLSTFIERPEPHLAGLIFHELAHQQLFIDDDTTFNESFAMAVEEAGAVRWLEARGLADQIASYELVKRWEKEFTELVLTYRNRLDEIYRAERSEAWKRQQKAATLSELHREYEQLKTSWGGYAGFDGWFEQDLNNARLALIGVYHQLVPAFLELLERHGGDLGAFYAAAADIAARPADERWRRMAELAPEVTPPLPGEGSDD